MLIFIIMGLYLGPNDPNYLWMYQNIFSPLSMTVWGFPVFWLASAAYRAFRARSAEAAILLITALITLLGMAPIGELISKDVVVVSNWIIAVPTIAASRGIIIGAALGTFILALRTLLGMEKRYLGGAEG
jgi:hypothetical protein